MQSTRRVCRLSTFVKETIANFLNIDKVFPALCIPACIGLSEWKWQDTYIVEHASKTWEVQLSWKLVPKLIRFDRLFFDSIPHGPLIGNSERM